MVLNQLLLNYYYLELIKSYSFHLSLRREYTPLDNYLIHFLPKKYIWKVDKKLKLRSLN